MSREALVEPTYIAQTFEPEHTADHEAERAWLVARSDDAWSHGCRFRRYTVRENPRGLLFEAWAEHPGDYGPERWQESQE